MSPRRAELLLLLCTLIWSSTFVVTKSTLAHFPPFAFLTLRFVIASVALAPFVWRPLRALKREGWRYGLWLGLLLFAGFVLSTYSLIHTTATRSAFFVGLQVVFAPFFQRLTGRRIAFDNVCGIVLATAGLYFFIGSEASGAFNRGDFAGLLCALVWGAYIVLVERAVQTHDTYAMTLIQLVIVALLSFGCALLESATLTPLSWPPLPWSLVGRLLYLALFATLIALVVQNRAQRETSPVRAVLIFSLEPVFAAALAYLFAGEHLSPIEIVGALIMLFAVLGSELRLFSKTALRMRLT